MSDSPVSLITGASRGIGEAIAIKLATEGHALALCGRDEARLRALTLKIKEMGNNVEFYCVDVTDPFSVIQTVDVIQSEFGRIDNLVNNAGLGIFKKFTESSLNEFKNQMDVNMYGVYSFTRAVVDGMITRKEGSIINVVSMAGKDGFVSGTMYCATKHAVIGFSKSLMLELREYNIRVSSIRPGSTHTEMMADAPIRAINMNTILQPEDVAEVVSTVIKLPIEANVSELEIRPTNPK